MGARSRYMGSYSLSTNYSTEHDDRTPEAAADIEDAADVESVVEPALDEQLTDTQAVAASADTRHKRHKRKRTSLGAEDTPTEPPEEMPRPHTNGLFKHRKHRDIDPTFNEVLPVLYCFCFL